MSMQKKGDSGGVSPLVKVTYDSALISITSKVPLAKLASHVSDVISRGGRSVRVTVRGTTKQVMSALTRLGTRVGPMSARITIQGMSPASSLRGDKPVG